MRGKKTALAAAVGTAAAGVFTLATFHLPSPVGGQLADRLFHRQKRDLPSIPATEVLEKYASENLEYLRQQRRSMLRIMIFRDETTARDRLQWERRNCARAALYLVQCIPPTLLGKPEQWMRELRTIAELGLLPNGIGQRITPRVAVSRVGASSSVSARSRLRAYYQREYRHFKELLRLANVCRQNGWEGRAAGAIQAEFERARNLSASFG